MKLILAPLLIGAACLSPFSFSFAGAPKPILATLKDGKALVGADLKPLSKPGDLIPNDVQIMAIPGTRVDLDIGKGKLLLSLRGNLPGMSPSPALESVISLHESSKTEDVALTLHRGRLVIESVKGPVKIVVRLKTDTLSIELSEKGSVVALELFSEWPEGARFVVDSPNDREPISTLYLLLAKGKAKLDTESQHYELTAPVAYVWSTIQPSPGPVTPRELPAWVAPDWKPLKKPAPKEGTSADEFYELAATSTLADYLRHLQSRITSEKERQAAIAPLRSVIDRSVKDEQAVYKALLEAEFKSPEAETFMQLLHGFGPHDRVRPETYDLLITYLGANRQEIRELAKWNLEKLVPAGRSINYDAASSPSDRATTQAAWRKLIPEGKIP